MTRGAFRGLGIVINAVLWLLAPHSAAAQAPTEFTLDQIRSTYVEQG